MEDKLFIRKNKIVNELGYLLKQSEVTRFLSNKWSKKEIDWFEKQLRSLKWKKEQEQAE